jgi:exosortase/archaeosortase family protein
MRGQSENNPLRFRDAAVYVGLSLAFIWVLSLLPTGWLEKLTAEACNHCLRMFGLDSSWSLQNGEAYLSLTGGARDVSVTIIRECTAINVFSIVVGLILPLYTSPVAKKASAIAASGILLFLMNVSRIAFTVYLTGYDVPPFSWFLRNPTLETYHYPVSFFYGVVGVAVLILVLSRWIIPELGDTLLGITELVYRIKG